MSRTNYNPSSRYQESRPPAILDPVVESPPPKPQTPRTKVHIALSDPVLSRPNFLTFDSTLSVITDNAGLVSLSEVRYDTRWLNKFTQLPLRPGQGYVRILESSPDVILENNQDDYGRQWICDQRGPPVESVWHHWWRSDPPLGPAKRLHDRLTLREIQDMLNCHEQCHADLMTGKTQLSFILPLSERETLYECIFAPVQVAIPIGRVGKGCLPQYIEDIIFSKLFTIFSIENFVLMTLKLFKEFGADKFPHLEDFIKDIYHVLDKLLNDKFEMSNINDHVRMDQLLWWLEDKNSPFSRVWRARWQGIRGYEVITSTRIQRDYICAIIDTLFGLWPAPGHCFLHDSARGSDLKLPSQLDVHGVQTENHWARAQDAIPRCINTGLYFWENLPPEPDVGDLEITKDDVENGASVSLVDLDAFLIERRLPFKFKVTNRLDMHLTITVDKEILIFPLWHRYLMLRHHKVLINDSSPDYPEDQITLFQLHSRSNRTAEERVRGIGGDVRFIAYELLQTYALLFFRDVSRGHRQSGQCQRRGFRSKRGYYYRQATVWGWPWLRQDPKNPDEIIDRLALGFGNGKGRPDSFMTLMEDIWEGDYFPQSGDFRFFGKRLEALNRELSVWKPSTLLEMLSYRGWVEEESNYWSLFLTAISVFVFALVSLVLNGVQLHYAIYPNSPSS